MPIHVDFRMTGPGLRRVHFVACRNALAPNGDLETGFFDQASEIRRHPEPGFSSAFNAALDTPDTDVLAIIRNPALVLDEDLPARIARAVAALPDSQQWALAGAGGLGLHDKRHLALYASATPAIPDPSGPHPLIDVMPDLYLVNAALARKVMAQIPAGPTVALETMLTVHGYLDDRVSLYMPQLSAGIDGALMSRDLACLSDELNGVFHGILPAESIPTLSGNITLGIPTPSARPSDLQRHGLQASLLAVIDRLSPLPRLSIITRTRFDRPALLRRLLASISRARHAQMDLEIILCSDAEATLCRDEMESLRREHLNLNLRFARNTFEGPSRVGNLLAGIQDASGEYVVVVDDDDYLDLFAFDNIRPAFFMDNRPIVVTSSQVHTEAWETTPNGRSVLSRSQQVNEYPASGWRKMFGGFNRLPICALLIPREHLLKRLDDVCLRHDLSEDYALFLLMLTDPALPAIHEVDAVFCHISLRGHENTVTMEDRRPWVRDISGHLANLTGADGAPGVASPGTWAMLSASQGTGEDPATSTAMVDLRQCLDRREREIKVLRRELAHLREQIHHKEQCV